MMFTNRFIVETNQGYTNIKQLNYTNNSSDTGGDSFIDYAEQTSFNNSLYVISDILLTTYYSYDVVIVHQ